MDNTLHTIQGLTRNWSFPPLSPVPRWRYRQAIEHAWKIGVEHGHRRPKWNAIKPLTKRSSWTVYFIYAPDGWLTPAHRFTLSRLKDSGYNLLVVCATREATLVPPELYAYADALFWKALEGYDFSAYTLALRQIGQQSSGADVLVMNDSVYGPFNDLKTCIAQSPWDLTGFTASSKLGDHIQSYAFGLRGVDRLRMFNLAPVFFPVFAISYAEAVIALQEARLARVASRSMMVGAFWYGDEKDVVDPTLVRPFELIEAGFPFIKRSLLGKLQKFQNPERVRELLRALGHPVNVITEREGT